MHSVVCVFVGMQVKSQRNQ